MTTTQAPQRTVAPKLLGTALVLAIGAWVAPALAAIGVDARCDQSVEGKPMSATDDEELTLRVIELESSRSAPDDTDSIDDGLTDPAPQSATRRDMPADLGAPLAVDKTDPPDDSATVLDSVQEDVTAGLPGFTPDQLHRYRQQMYRTDI